MQVIVQTKQMKIDLFHNLKPKTDLDRTLGKNSLRDRLVRLVPKFAKLITETSSKMQELKTYNETIKDSFYGNKWRKVVNKKLWNFDAYQI